MKKNILLTFRNLRAQRRFCRAVACVSSFLMLTTCSAPAFAAGTAVLGGDATLTGATRAALNTGSATDSYAQFVADAGANSAVLDWSKFNIGAGKEMNFNGAGTTFFNLVDGAASKSQIDGLISGNGSVWVINPNGIAFGANSQVNVGGIFAAAAGNLSNADQLRDGTSTLPTFSDYAGAVTAKDATFKASYVRFDGAKVGVDGIVVGSAAKTASFRTNARGLAVVDSVGGGEVSIDCADFGDELAEADLYLGDLQVWGNFSAGSDGDVKISGTQNVLGGYSVGTVKGNITVASEADVCAWGDEQQLMLESGCGVKSTGSVTVNGSLSAVGDEGMVLLHSACGEGSSGSISVNGRINANGTIQLFSAFGEKSSGNVQIGNLTSDGSKITGGLINSNGDSSNVDIVSGYGKEASGDVTVKGYVQASGSTGSVRIFAGYGAGEGSKGDLTIGEADAAENGAAILSMDKVQFNVYDGDITVNKGSSVRTFAEDGQILMKSGVSAGEKGGMVIDGIVNVNGKNSAVLLNAGYAEGAKGDIVIGKNARVEANYSGGSVQIVAGQRTGTDGNVRIEGRVTAADRVDVEAGLAADFNEDDSIKEIHGSNGDVTIAEDAYVAANAEVKLVTYHGDIVIKENSTVTTKGLGGDTILRAGDIKGGSGSIEVRGTVLSEGTSGWTLDDDNELVFASPTVSLFAAPRPSSQGGIKIESEGVVKATGDYALMQIATGLEDAAASEELTTGGDVNITGTVRAEGDYSKVFVWGGYGDYTKGDVSIAGTVANEGASGQVKVWASRGNHTQGDLDVSGTVSANGANSYAYLFASRGDYSKGNLNLSGSMMARGENGKVEASAARGFGASGNVVMSGAMDAYTRAYLSVANGKDSSGELLMSGTMLSGGWLGDGDQLNYSGTTYGNSMIVCGLGENSVSSGTLSGSLVALGSEAIALFDGARGVKARSDLTITDSGELLGRGQVTAMTWNGNVEVDGCVASISGSACEATVAALGDDASAGNIFFGENGMVQSDATANVLADGNVRQDGAHFSIVGGRAEAVSLKTAVEAPTINVRTKGSVGNGSQDGVAVSGNLRAVVDGDASFAAANGEDFFGGGNGRPDMGKIKQAQVEADATIDGYQKSGKSSPEEREDEQVNNVRNLDVVDTIASDFDAMGSGVVMAGGDLSFYTMGKLRSNGLFSAGGDLSVSAATFGDMSYLQAGGFLSINNAGKPAYPQIAYFESVNGVEPTINNQPNDTVIFVDGRLAGGNLKILNQFGANEAFLVSTPELKSTQGIFGNPTFLHSDLDVANPMEVSAIDYMLQETPRLTLDKEFPAEVDSHVDSVVVPERDSIQFGRDAKDDAAAEPDEKVAETASADGKVALAR